MIATGRGMNWTPFVDVRISETRKIGYATTSVITIRVCQNSEFRVDKLRLKLTLCHTLFLEEEEADKYKQVMLEYDCQQQW